MKYQQNCSFFVVFETLGPTSFFLNGESRSLRAPRKTDLQRPPPSSIASTVMSSSSGMEKPNSACGKEGLFYSIFAQIYCLIFFSTSSIAPLLPAGALYLC
jgi:hypothetical protein